MHALLFGRLSAERSVLFSPLIRGRLTLGRALAHSPTPAPCLCLRAAVLDGIVSGKGSKGEAAQERQQMGFILHSLLTGAGGDAAPEEADNGGGGGGGPAER